MRWMRAHSRRDILVVVPFTLSISTILPVSFVGTIFGFSVGIIYRFIAETTAVQ